MKSGLLNVRSGFLPELRSHGPSKHDFTSRNNLLPSARLTHLRKHDLALKPTLSFQYCSQAVLGRRKPAARALGDASADPEAAALEIEKLQQELEVAVKAEDYSVAASIRDRLRRLQDDEEAAVVAANSLFYRAFANSDLRRMRQIWAKEDYVQCIHPGSNCIQGYDMVMESWDVILSGERRLNIEIEGLRCHVKGGMAFVTCVEVLRSQGSSGRVIATNLFEKKNDQWFLVLHQGAPAPSGAMFA